METAGKTKDMEIITQSQIKTFLTCQERARLRYDEWLVPTRERDDALRFGTLVHESLDLWYSEPTGAQNVVQYAVKKATGDHDPLMAMRVTALLEGYFARYPLEEYDVVAVEMPFDGVEIVNPATGGRSRTFALSGKVDLVLRHKKSGRLWIMEHKTASFVDAAYVDRLRMDFQIITYRRAVETVLGEPVDGVIYNVCLKNKLELHKGETPEEYEARDRARYAAKEGETEEERQKRIKRLKPLKRDDPETAGQLAVRMREWHARPEAYFRQELIIGTARDTQFQQQLWNVCQQILLARRHGIHTRNTTECVTRWGAPCPYLPICAAEHKEAVIEAEFRREAPHQELKEKNDATEARVAA